jgi:hypothetical protein
LTIQAAAPKRSSLGTTDKSMGRTSRRCGKRSLGLPASLTSTLLCRACMHSFFHQLSILERATDHECINNRSYSKRNVGGIQVQRSCEFSQRGGISNTTQAFYRPAFPPPPTKLLLLSLVTPPPPPQAPLLSRRGHLWLWGSGRGVLSRVG